MRIIGNVNIRIHWSHSVQGTEYFVQRYQPRKAFRIDGKVPDPMRLGQA